MVRAEHHIRDALTDDFGLVCVEHVRIDLNDHRIFCVGPVTPDQLLQPLARVGWQRVPDGGDFLGRAEPGRVLALLE